MNAETHKDFLCMTIFRRTADTIADKSFVTAEETSASHVGYTDTPVQ